MNYQDLIGMTEDAILAAPEPVIAPVEANLGCYNCTHCNKCKGCSDCENCTSCVACLGCNDCNNCNACYQCSNCYNVTRGAYLAYMLGERQLTYAAWAKAMRLMGVQ